MVGILQMITLAGLAGKGSAESIKGPLPCNKYFGDFAGTRLQGERSVSTAEPGQTEFRLRQVRQLTTMASDSV
jgi:hypothetical protein